MTLIKTIKRILREEIEDEQLRDEDFKFDEKIFNFLLRRFKLENHDIGLDDDKFIFKTINFKIEGDDYMVSNTQNKQTQIQQIFDMLKDFKVIENINLYGNTNNKRKAQIVKTIKKFI